MSAEQIGLAFLVYSVLCAAAGGFVAFIKKRSVGQWVLLCFLLGVIGIIIVASLAELQPRANAASDADHGSKVMCKECGKYWHPQALKDGVCTVCHRRRLNLKLKRPSHPA